MLLLKNDLNIVKVIISVVQQGDNLTFIQTWHTPKGNTTVAGVKIEHCLLC